jgi:hypothetical protein
MEPHIYCPYTPSLRGQGSVFLFYIYTIKCSENIDVTTEEGTALPSFA